MSAWWRGSRRRRAIALLVEGLSQFSGATTGGTRVTITGRHFLRVTSVLFGTTPAAFTVVSPTQIIATSPAHTAGTVDIRVVTIAGISPISAVTRFTYRSAGSAPGISPPPAAPAPPSSTDQPTSVKGLSSLVKLLDAVFADLSAFDAWQKRLDKALGVGG